MTDPRALIYGHLDGVLTAEEEAALNEWLKADPANAAEFAAVVRLHDRLRAAFAPAAPAPPKPAAADRPPRRWRRVGVLAGLAVGLLAGLSAVWWMTPAPLSAAAELDRLIVRSDGTGDRTYVIRSLDPNPAPTEPRQPPIDGAQLSIRPPDRYVLVRHFPDGRPYVTGSDGERNWDVPPTAPVRLSRDPLRFRWPLPGHQHGIPFADLRSDLVQLRDAYHVSALGTDTAGRRGLLAEKKSAEYRGPRRVELWYDPATGVIHRMVFAGLPKARGGPDSVAVELVDQDPLPPDFFQHIAHHTPDRRVIEED
jgi:hypothetical protein